MSRLPPPRFPICVFRTCTNGQVFPQEVQRSLSKIPAFNSITTNYRIYMQLR